MILKLSDAENRPILLLYVQNLVTLYFDPPFFFGQYFSTSASSSSISETLALGWFRKLLDEQKISKIKFLSVYCETESIIIWKTDILIGNNPFTWRSITLDYENNARPGTIRCTCVWQWQSANDCRLHTGNISPLRPPHCALTGVGWTTLVIKIEQNKNIKISHDKIANVNVICLKL